MNPNKFNEKNSAELEKSNISELKSFIDPENYLNYFNNRMAPNPDIKYTDDDSYEEVDKLVDTFNTLNRRSSNNKEVFTNLLNFSYCRAAQFKAFNYYHIPSYTGAALKAVFDVKSKSEFVNGVIEKIMFNEAENSLVEHNSFEVNDSSIDFMKDLTDFGPDHRQLYVDVINHNRDELNISKEKSLSEQYIEIEVLSLFGVNMADINEASRDYLFDWGVNLTNYGYSKLKEINEVKPLSYRIEMANASLSIEFGDDFGDRLIKIADKYDDKTSERIFSNINQIRHDSISIAEHFNFERSDDNSDKDISKLIEKAWIKRTTEVLAILADDYVDEDDIECALTSLDILKYATNSINDSLSQEFSLNESSLNQESDHVTLMSENNVTVTLRPNFDPEKWNQRIGFNVKIPADLVSDKVKLVKGRNKRISIRLDYDEFGLSLDIGSMNTPGLNNISPTGVLVGETLIKGESLINGDVKHGNHVREVFEGYDMNTDVFTEIVKNFAKTLNVAA